MTPTVEQLRAAGVGEPAIRRWQRDLAAAIAGPAGDEVVRRARECATPREVAAAAGIIHPLVFRLDFRVASAKNSTDRKLVRGRLLTVKSDTAQAWQQKAVAQLVAQRPRHHVAIEHPVRVEVRLFGPITHPWSVDGDNGQSACWDALVKAEILADDRARIIRAWGGEWLPAAGWSAEITIIPYVGPAA